MSALRLLSFGVVVLAASNAMAAPHAHATAPATPPASVSTNEVLKVPPTTDPPRSRAPTTEAVEPTLYQDTSEPKRQLVLEGALGATAGCFLAASVPLFENPYSNTGGALSHRQAELDSAYALVAVGGVLAIADLVIAVMDAQRVNRLLKAREAGQQTSSALTIRF
jgi:hypothetical protein